MREPPKALGPIGSAGGGGLVWAAQQFHWEWPTWAVDLVACVSTIFLIWTLISGVQWLWHVLNDWRANHGYSRLYVDSSYIIVALLSGAAALLIAAAIVFFAHSATATTEKIAATPKPLIRPETRLRLRLDPSGTRNYLQESKSNVANWQQTIVAMSAQEKDTTTSIVHADTFSMVFTEPVEYERPIIKSFGHKLGGFSFFSLGTRGAVFQFYDAVQAPMIEIWFPPPGYYDQQSRLKSAAGTQKAKEYSPRTVQEIFAFHQGRSGLEADKLLSPHKGLWISSIEGIIGTMSPDGGGAMIVLRNTDGAFECHFPSQWV